MTMFFGDGPEILLRRIGDEVDRIGAAAVLGEARVVEVEFARVSGSITTFSSTVPKRLVVA